jgi:cell division septation protein DedD
MAENNASKFKVKIPKLNASSKTYDFSLSLSGMISAVGSGVLVLTFFFVMGILIGRGYRPESDVPPLGEIMPTKEHGVLVGELVKPEVLTAEELEYPERLMVSPQKRMDEVGVKEKASQPKAKSVAKVAKSTDSGSAKSEVVQQTASVSDEPVYDYVYQVASFRKSEMAEAMRAKLVATGLRTTIEAGEAKGSTWHRVLVLHHGTPASTAGMKTILAQHGVSKPLLKKKKASQ